MSPTHANKKGVRYRYYTSHALLQRRKEHAGSVPRVPAPEVEALVCKALRREDSAAAEASDKELIAQRVSTVIIRRDQVEVEIRDDAEREDPPTPTKLVIPFSPIVTVQEGITREPLEDGQIDAVAREKLLNAIRRASRWVEAVRSGEAKSFAAIGSEEGVGERHVRRLAQLAFLSPKVAAAILDESAPAGLTISHLTEALPHRWVAQDDMFGSVHRLGAHSDQSVRTAA